MLRPISIFLILLGGIFTFAFRWEPSFLNLDAIGITFMLVGVLGLILWRSILQRRREAARISGRAHIPRYDHPGAMPVDPRDPRADD